MNVCYLYNGNEPYIRIPEVLHRIMVFDIIRFNQLVTVSLFQYDYIFMDLCGEGSESMIKKLQSIVPGIRIFGILKSESLNYFRAYYRMGLIDIVVLPADYKDIKRQILGVVDYCSHIDSSLGDSPFFYICGDSWGKRLKSLLLIASECDDSVLILGETGTGKDLLAQEIHCRSKRSSKPYVAFNCSSIPSSLLSSELFGSEKGAFTDACKKIGKVEAAGSGTLFLDELGELGKDSQVKFLRLLENREFSPLGSNELREMNARVIAAASQPLSVLKKERFRSDFYYRLSTLIIQIPPLRSRRKDIPVLMKKFVKEMKSEKKFSSIAVEKMLEYNWPGNIRQLKNIVRRSILLSPSEIIYPDDIDFA